MNMFLRQLRWACQPQRRYSTGISSDFASAIAELNKEMESVFGEPPSANQACSSNANLSTTRETPFAPHENAEAKQGLTHISSSGEAQMVDVSSKEITKRVAIAGCKVILGKKAYDLVSANQIAKGDVLSVAKIAGISGAKQTSSLIPLCHNINLSHVRVDLKLSEKDFSVDIEGEAASTGKTGVEMEAMTAVAIAGLTVYDMCKAASKDITVTDVQLKYKAGGKSGEWSRKK
ncbi:hypothetical protein Scep_025524 [Stephania cephalantha]|uniref:cyclic pyranopterin monophosphate synthase n=1 Tax=Stephania cephalantha TaxID=152367 RepID=A0AAP0EKX7_9MAGN